MVTYILNVGGRPLQFPGRHSEKTELEYNQVIEPFKR